jgi:hypothetical protein
VDGSGNGISECSPDLIGIFYQNASGELNHVAVRDVELSPTLNGCQSGVGVFVQSGGGVSSVVTIANSRIHDYQKNGITANEADTQVTISGNVLTGLGTAAGTAQNGIQIGFGATGTIHANTVANHVYAPCIDLTGCPATADDILVYQSDGVTVDHNTAGVSQTGIAIVANNANVLDNTVFDSLVFDGVLLQGNGNSATGNHITRSDQAAVVISGNSNTVQQEVINDATIGILTIAGSTGTTIGINTFFNTPVQMQDPAPSATRQASPGAIESASQILRKGGWTGERGIPLQTLPMGLDWTIPSELYKSIWVNPSPGEPMAERFSEIGNRSVPSKPTLEERLKEYPELKAKIETMLGIIENAGGDIEKAAEAERRIIEELRQMGNEVLHGWARGQQAKKEQEYNAKPGVNRKEKKPLLVHATGKNRNRRTDLHRKSTRAADATLFRIRGSGVPWVCGRSAAGHDRFWCR